MKKSELKQLIKETMDERYILQSMIKVSNNSQLTNLVCNAIKSKLDDKQKHDFTEWLRIVEREKQIEADSNRRNLTRGRI